MTEEQTNPKDDVESRARNMGWADEESFRGSPDLWVSAEEFVRRGENEIPIMRERLRAMDSNLNKSNLERSRLEGKIDSLTRSQVDLANSLSKAAYERARKEIEAEKRDAAENGDLDRFDRAQSKIDDLDTAVEKVQPPEPPATNQQSGDHPDFAGWVSQNPWYNDDYEMSSEADRYGAFMVSKGRATPGRDVYDKTTAHIKKKYPEKFGAKPLPAGQASVEAGSGSMGAGNAGGAKKRSYNGLPADAKAACDMLVAEGILTKEQYVKDYEWEK